MAVNAKPWTLSEQVGAIVRHERERLNLRQEDLVRAARGLQLDWSRTSVAQLEAGRRELSAAELLLLQHVFRYASDGRSGFDVAELLSTELARQWKLTTAKRVRVAGVELDDATMRNMLAGRTAHRRGVVLEESGSVKFVPPEPKAADAERKAARRFDVPPAEVVRASVERWGRTLTDERDRRVGDAGSDAETIRALRGHVTRQLLAELEQSIVRKGARRGAR